MVFEFGFAVLLFLIDKKAVRGSHMIHSSRQYSARTGLTKQNRNS